jgi:hypothetical protein
MSKAPNEPNGGLGKIRKTYKLLNAPQGRGLQQTRGDMLRRAKRTHHAAPNEPTKGGQILRVAET